MYRLILAIIGIYFMISILLSIFNNQKKEVFGKGLILIGYLLFVLHYLGY